MEKVKSVKKIITNIEQLTPEWLTGILKKKGCLSNGKVVKIIQKNLRETTTAYVHFLEIQFSKEYSKDFSADVQADLAPSAIVVKISKPKVIEGRYEPNYYNIVAGELRNDLPIPICYDAAYSEETGLSHIILEDISDTHSEVEFEWPVSPTKQLCEKAIDCISEIHAFWWDHPKLNDLTKFTSVYYYWTKASFNEQEILRWFNDQKASVKQPLEFWEDKISADRIELIKTVFALPILTAAEQPTSFISEAKP